MNVCVCVFGCISVRACVRVNSACVCVYKVCSPKKSIAPDVALAGYGPAFLVAK